MEKFYLYGAGINGIEICNFLGSENVIAVIDGNPNKQGKKYIDDIPTISLQEYNDVGAGKLIIVTPYQNKAICDCLDKAGIKSYYVAPWMQRFFDSIDQIVQELDLNRYEVIWLSDGNNPFLMKLADSLKGKKINVYDSKKVLDSKSDNQCFICVGTEKSLPSLQGVDCEYINLIDRHEAMIKQIGSGLAEFRDLYAGESCFLIGNAPSLRYSDLNTLHDSGVFCFGVNSIYEAFEHTKWRPNAYAFVDCTMLMSGDFFKFAPNIAKYKFVRHNSQIKNVKELNNYHEFWSLLQPEGGHEFSLDIEQGVYNGFSVVYEALQLAVYMGFSSIYFLGVDLRDPKAGEKRFYHFYGDKDYDENSALERAQFEKTRYLLGEAGTMLKKRGVNLYNATRGGELDEIPRVDFDSLFTDGKFTPDKVVIYSRKLRYMYGNCGNNKKIDK